MKYQLTDEQIEYFRSITPLRIDGELVPFKIVCEGKYYPDPRGKAKCVVYIKDYSCKVSTAYPETKAKLQKHFVNFMSSQFEDYAEDYIAICEQREENKAKL